MGILLAFAPFFIYVLVERLADVKAGLIAATVVSAALLVRDALRRDRSIKVLELGTLLLFGGLAAYALMAGATWSIPAVRLRVDTGLLLIVLISIVIRQPFTMQYAREQVSSDLWTSPQFLRTNYIITAVWAVAFAIMIAADLAMLYMPALPTRTAIIVTILAIYGAFRFTAWYPHRSGAKSSN
jgi:uncharacterized membrane protein (UPF0136 family)